MKLYMFRTVCLPIIRSLFTVHSAMVYVIRVCRQLSSRTRMFHPGPARQWTNSRWQTEGLSETCRVSCRNKFVKLVHLVGFIVKKYGHFLLLLPPIHLSWCINSQPVTWRNETKSLCYFKCFHLNVRPGLPSVTLYVALISWWLCYS